MQESDPAANQTAERGPDSGNSLEAVVARLATGYRSIGDMVYEVIREAILSGAFPPGERLRQEALATAIGVSRIPVRAALLKLDAEGLIELSAGRGAVVQSLSHAQIVEIYELRDLLETHALRKSMARMDSARIDRLRKLATELDNQIEGDSFLELRVVFYRELYDADNAPRLVELIEGLRSSLGRYLLGWRVSDPHGHGHHSALIEYVAAGDTDSAVAWLHKHLQEVSAGVDNLLHGADAPAKSTKTKRR